MTKNSSNGGNDAHGVGRQNSATDQERTFKFPAIIKLVREAEDAGRKADGFLWRVGDALLAECGPPGRVGVNTGTIDRLNKVAAELKRAGLGGNWSLVYLRKLRSTADAFRDDNRLSSVPWTVHLAAGKPANLADIVSRAKSQGEPLTVSVAKKLRRQILADAKPEPSHDRAKAAIVEARVIREAAAIKQKIIALQRDLKPHLNLIDPERADGIVLGWMEVILAAKELLSMVRTRGKFRQAAE